MVSRPGPPNSLPRPVGRDLVVALPAGDSVGPVVAVEPVVTAAAVDVVVPGAARQDVGARTAAQHVGAHAAKDVLHVGADRIALAGLATCAADERGDRGGPFVVAHDVGSVAARHDVRAGAADEGVVAGAAREHVVSGTAAQEGAGAPRGRAAIRTGAELDRPRQPVGERDGVVAVATVDVGPHAGAGRHRTARLVRGADHASGACLHACRVVDDHAALLHARRDRIRLARSRHDMGDRLDVVRGASVARLVADLQGDGRALRRRGRGEHRDEDPQPAHAAVNARRVGELRGLCGQCPAPSLALLVA
jgi:hypothetical protein